MDDDKIDMATVDKTLDRVVWALKYHASKLHSIYFDQSEAKWLRDEAYNLYLWYKDAADFVSNLKEAL